MRRENKLALIVGFSVLLVVAVLVSDHLSTARQDEVEAGLDTLLEIPGGKAFVTEPLRAEGRVGRGADLGDSPRFATGERVNPTETQVAQAETGRAAGRATPRYSDPTPTRSAPTETLGTPELVERYASSSGAGPRSTTARRHGASAYRFAGGAPSLRPSPRSASAIGRTW